MQSNDKRRIGLGALAMATVMALGLAGSALWPMVADAKGDDGTLTHSFRKASPEEVLAWMQKQGIEVKFQKGDLPEKELTFAFDGIKPDLLVQRLGDLLGLQAQKKGNVYSLLKGVGSDSPTEFLGSEGADRDFGLFEGTIFAPTWDDQEKEQYYKELEQLKDKMPEGGFWYALPGIGQDAKSIVDEVMKALEEAGVFQGKKLSEDQKAELRAKLLDRIARAHGGMKGMPDGFKYFELPGGEHGKFMLDPEHMKLFQNDKELAEAQKAHAMAMEEFKKAMGDEGMLKFKAMQSDEFKKAMEQSHEAMKRAFEEMKLHGKGQKLSDEDLKMMKEGRMLFDGDAFQYFNSDAFKKAMEEMHKQLGDQKQYFDNEAFRKSMEEMHKDLGEKMKVLQIKLENLKKFMASLTPEQRELADKQGYLKPSDLTREQRELLGIGEGGKSDVNMTFQLDGKKIAIRSKEKSEETPKKSGGGGVITA